MTTSLLTRVPRSFGATFLAIGLTLLAVPGARAQGHTNVAYYGFEDGNTLTSDMSGNGNGIAGSVSFGGGTEYITNDAESGNYAVYFYNNGGAGVSWLSTSPNLASTLAGSFSVAVWLKTTQVSGSDTDDGTGNNAGIVATFNNGSANFVSPMVLTGGKLAFVTGGATEDTLHSATSVNSGQYVHVVVTRDQVTGQKDIYVNGVLDASDTGAQDLLNSTTEVDLGAENFHGFQGDLDEVQFYSGVLSSNEVAYLFHNPGTPVPNVYTDFNVALGTTNFAWTNTGDTSWSIEADDTDGSQLAAQSGSVSNSQSSTLSVTVAGPATIGFDWSSFAEDPNGGFHYQFYIDDALDGELDGDHDWTTVAPIFMPAGQHTLKWTVNAGGDTDPTEAGYLDSVVFTPLVPSFVHANAAPRFGAAPLTVQFTSPDIDDQGNAVSSWNWTFGDGTTSQAQSPAHTYTNLGAYVPTLSVTAPSALLPVLVTGPGTISVTTPPATVVSNLPGSLAGFTYNNFSNLASMRLNGSATAVTSGGHPAIQLTPASANQAGSAFSANPIPLAQNAGFSSFFTFRLSQPVSGQGNGITFAIQGDSCFDVGGSGAQLGYGGISNSLAVEFATSNPGNLVAVSTNGILNNAVSAPVTDPMDNGNIWYAWVDYSGVSQRLEVRLSEVPVRPLTNVLATTVDLRALVADTNLPVAGNLLSNGGFEYEPNWGGGIEHPKDPYATALTGSDIPGWTIEPNHAATIHLANGPYAVISGQYTLNTDGEGYMGHNANLYQDFPTVVSNSYTLSFNWQSWGYGQPIHEATQLKVTVMDTVTSIVLFTGLYSYEDNGPHPVHTVTANFSGTGHPLRLRIEQSPEDGANDQMFVADNFSVVPSASPVNAYAGFTGSTGSSWNTQDILSWKFKALPTARFTAHYALTNVPPTFQLTNGLMEKLFIYVVNGVTYTNIYLVKEEFVDEPDGSEDAVTQPESTPVIDEDNGEDGEIEEVAVMSEYVGGDNGDSGVYVVTDSPPPNGTSFAQSYPGDDESDTMQDLEDVSANPPPPGSPTQNSPTEAQNAMNAMNQNLQELSSDQQQQQQIMTQIIQDVGVGYSSSTNHGPVTVRQQVLMAPPLRLTLSAPRAAGTNFNFFFTTVSNQSYTIWNRTNLSAGNWVVSTNFAGSGYPTTFTNSVTNAPKGFYRASSP